MVNTSFSKNKSWHPGAIVKIGFMQLRVVSLVPTPGDYAPDAYALQSLDGSKYYHFVPHNGLTRCESLKAALTA